MNELTPIGRKIHDHLESSRPKMFQELKNNGNLNQYVLDEQNRINNRLTDLEEQGMQPHEAMELMRDEVYLPTKEDVPNLGEPMQPYTD